MTHKGTVRLETKRLILRQFTTSDLEPMFHNCWRDTDVWKWTNYETMNTIDDVLTLNNIFTDHWFSRYEQSDWYSWAIQLKGTGEVIGRIRGMNPNNRIQQVELAYELGRNWWNQGYTTEAVEVIIDFFFKEVGLHRIYANHANKNPASGRVMQKCGMRYEGISREWCVCNAGRFDGVNYAILAKDYLSKSKNNFIIIPYVQKYHDDMLFCYLEAKDAIGRYAPDKEWSKPTLRDDLYDVEKNYFECGDIFYLAINECDRVVGMMGTQTTSPTELWLKRFFIKPELKGKGIGSKLLLAVEEYAVRKSISEIHTRFAYWYREAAAFYPVKGFLEVERSNYLIHMSKRLD